MRRYSVTVPHSVITSSPHLPSIKGAYRTHTPLVVFRHAAMSSKRGSSATQTSVKRQKSLAAVAAPTVRLVDLPGDILREIIRHVTEDGVLSLVMFLQALLTNVQTTALAFRPLQDYLMHFAGNLYFTSQIGIKANN